uniref:Capsid protein n=1 Tax=Paguma larvata torque teno virus TaxID=2219036 RepID=A0A348BSQ6_9VIRU|nr:hypothetical protein [Paguma larvata torque teno virus]
MRYRSFYRGRRYHWRPRRRGRGVLRRWFGRRWRVRRRARRGRRRRGYKKRQYITPIMQWMPKSRIKCTIKGWTYAITVTSDNPQGRAADTTTRPTFEYKPNLGQTNIITFSLKWFYWEWQHFRNTWSNSNDGYDLARYFGTVVKAWPHPTIDYGLWWDTEYQEQTIDDFRKIQPAVLQLQKNHVIVKSMRNGGKRAKIIKLRPPSTQDTNWYMQDKWCVTGLARLGISLINFDKPLLHTQRKSLAWFWGFTSSKTNPDKDNWKNPVATPDYSTKITTITNNTVGPQKHFQKAYYRPDMDDGKDNMVRVMMYISGNWTTSYIVTNNMPYYIWFYGWRYGDIADLGLPPNKKWDQLPIEMLAWWYDYDGTDAYNFKGNSKQWIVLSTTETPNIGKNAATGGISEMLYVTTSGPFAHTDKDINYIDSKGEFLNLNISIPIYYKSYWQWGGQSVYTGKDIKNPCPTNIVRGVPVADPTTTSRTTLHPWDMDTTGFITKDKFAQLIAPSRSTEDPMDSHPQTQEDSEEEDSDISTDSSDWPASEEEELSEDGGLTQTRRKAEIAALRAKHERQRRKQYQRRLRSWLAKL